MEAKSNRNHARISTKYTYGLASAPYLATRCLMQLAIENQEQYPEACKMLREDFYVDDLLTGGSSVSTLKTIKIDLTNILRSAGFTFHKWNSNESTIVTNFSELPAHTHCLPKMKSKH